MKLDRHLIALDDQILNMKLRTFRKNPRQLGECAFDEGLLARIVAGQWMGAHDCPVNVVGYMVEKGGAIAPLEPLENLQNTLACKGHNDFAFHVPVTSRITRR